MRETAYWGVATCSLAKQRFRRPLHRAAPPLARINPAAAERLVATSLWGSNSPQASNVLRTFGLAKLVARLCEAMTLNSAKWSPARACADRRAAPHAPQVEADDPN